MWECLPHELSLNKTPTAKKEVRAANWRHTGGGPYPMVHHFAATNVRIMSKNLERENWQKCQLINLTWWPPISLRSGRHCTIAIDASKSTNRVARRPLHGPAQNEETRDTGRRPSLSLQTEEISRPR